MSYVDSLVHVTPDGRWFGTNIDASEARLLDEMDRCDVERAVVVALPGYIDNDFVRQVCRRYDDRLLAGAAFDPSKATTESDVRSRLRAEIRDEDVAVLKLHPRLNRYDPLEPRAVAMFEELSSWGRPPLIWLDSLLYPPGVDMQRSLVDTLRGIATRFGKLRFVLLHAGGARVMELYDACAPLGNVLLDLSYSLTRYEGSSIGADHRFLVQRFDRRTVFGSDFPEVSLPDATSAFERLVDGLPRANVDNVRRSTLMAWLSHH